MKYLALSTTSHTPRFTLIKSIACGLALLASGQVFATLYYSTSATAPTSEADFTDGTKWSTSSTNCATTANDTAVGGTITLTGNDFYICNGHTLTLSADYTFAGNWFGLYTGGTIDLNGKTLTFSATSPTISTWYNTSVSGSITGNGNLVFNGNGMVQGNNTIDDKHTVNNVTTVGTLVSAPAPAPTNYHAKIVGNVTVGGNVSGSVRFTDASHSITSTAPAITVANVNLALVTTAGRTITFVPAAGSSITVTGFTAPTATVALVCSGGTASGTITGGGSSTTSINSGYTGGDYVCTRGAAPVSASIGLNMNKQVEIYSTEIE